MELEVVVVSDGGEESWEGMEKHGEGKRAKASRW